MLIIHIDIFILLIASIEQLSIVVPMEICVDITF